MRRSGRASSQFETRSTMPEVAASSDNSRACTTYRLSRIRNSVARCAPSYPWVNTFRPSNGRTSSGFAFWLIPAMRIKDRRGPGIMNCDEVDVVPPEREPPGASEDFAWAARGNFPLLANRSQFNRETAIRKETQTGDFTAGYLAEPG